MNREVVARGAGACLVMALAWALSGAVELAWTPWSGGMDSARAANHTNPDNPDSAQDPGATKDPASPDPAQDTSAMQDSASPDPAQDTSAMQDPASPDPAQDTSAMQDPAQPHGIVREPSLAPAGGKKMESTPREEEDVVLEWAKDYRTWNVVSGYVLSSSHGNRIVQTYISPPEAARIYKENATLRREQRPGFNSYPEGASILQRSWVPDLNGAPGEPGPMFFMRKESSGYDSEGGDWRYGLAREDFSIIGQGFSKEMAFCKECHSQVQDRDFLYSVDR